jgi:aerobic-type carbon monoxide dehydrogenase small subunit (CoxS/CutS family)
VTPPKPSLRVNGRLVQLDAVPSDELLLDTLRWRLDLRGTKEGCRSGECGACTVLVDGQSRLSCLALTHELEGTAVTTIEEVHRDPVGRAVQQAFSEEGGLQCGYCTPGYVMAVTGVLRERGKGGTTEQLLEALGGNLCRCTGYGSIVRSVEAARRKLP